MALLNPEIRLEKAPGGRAAAIVVERGIGPTLSAQAVCSSQRTIVDGGGDGPAQRKVGGRTERKPETQSDIVPAHDSQAQRAMAPIAALALRSRVIVDINHFVQRDGKCVCGINEGF